MTDAGPVTGLQEIPRDGLSRLDVPVDCGAVVLGFDRSRDSVAVQLFRSRPTQVGMLAGGYAARLLAFRAHAVGARVQIVTPHPEPWRALVGNGPTGRTMFVAEGAPLLDADADSPVLRLEQGLPRLGPLDLGPWQTRVVIQDSVVPQAVPALRSFDLVLVQRLQPDVAVPLQTTMRLSDEDAAWLPKLPDNTIAVITPGRIRLTALGPTPQETAIFGAPDRHAW
jgi:hypothetical protein